MRALSYMTPLALLVGIAFVLADTAFADGRVDEIERDVETLERDIEALRQRVTSKPIEIRRRQGVLAREIARLRESIVLPDDTAALEGRYGLAPAASKVYGTRSGLSIGGYGELAYRAALTNSGDDDADIGRLILYTGFKFNDWILFNSELEIEHASTADTVTSGGGFVALELAALEFLMHPRANVRAGLLLVPMGFINEVHEPPFFHGNMRPPVELAIIPSTWRSNGIGLFGEILPGLEYRTYGLTSFNAKGFRSEGLRRGKQGGNRELAEDWSWVARLDYETGWGPIGGSLFIGDQGQKRAYGNDTDGFFEADVFLQMYEAHIEIQRGGVELRALGAVVFTDDTDILNTDPEILGYDPTEPADPASPRPAGGVAERMYGAYAEVAYDIMPLFAPDLEQYLAPWFRYSRIDNQESVVGVDADDALGRDIFEVGLTYKPTTQVVLKLDYQHEDRDRGPRAKSIRVGAGFVF